MLVLLAAVSAATMPCPIGTWALEAGDRTIFRFEITNASSGTTAIWERPGNFETDGESFSDISDPTVRRPAVSIKTVDGDLVVSFDDPRPRATPDIFRFHCIDTGHLKATYQGTGFEPFDLVRARTKGVALGPWGSERSFTRVIARPTNTEMTAIFNADQADRQADNINWSVVGPADKMRQKRTQELLDAGALQSGEDYYHAAFVFQHGGKSDDYLKAHLLATVAVARGKPGAVWIASATLDRYLQTTGKPQVLGTQFTIPNDAPATQEPYDRALVSDAMRKALHVPAIAEQEQRRQQFSAKAGSSKP